MSKGKILVIEDDLNWQNDLAEFLESDGYLVDIVSNVKNALTTLERSTYHFITLDMRLSGDDDVNYNDFEGWQVLDTIKKLRIQSFSPVMVITGHGVEYIELKAIKKLESLFFMEKGDFDVNQFLRIVNTAVARIGLTFKDNSIEE